MNMHLRGFILSRLKVLVFALVTATFWGSNEVRAQQSTVTGDISGATGAAQARAVFDIENAVLDRQTAGRKGGAGPGGSNEKGGQQGGAAVIPGAFPTGRLRYSEHDGYDGTKSGHAPPASFDLTETSLFASVFANVPGSVFGGKMQVGAFAGVTDLDMKVGPRRHRPNEPSNGEAENTSLMSGIYVVQAWQWTYAMLTAAGAWGETSIAETRRNLSKPSKYDTYGFTSSAVVGQYMPLGKTALMGKYPLFADFRGGLSYTHNEGDRFRIYSKAGALNQILKPSVTAVGGQFSTSLFTVIGHAGGAFTRPYVKANLRHDFYYDQKLDNVAFVAAARPTKLFSYEKADTTIGAEIGFDHKAGQFKFSGSTYFDYSADEAAIGARLGATYQFN